MAGGDRTSSYVGIMLAVLATVVVPGTIVAGLGTGAEGKPAAPAPASALKNDAAPDKKDAAPSQRGSHKLLCDLGGNVEPGCQTGSQPPDPLSPPRRSYAGTVSALFVTVPEPSWGLDGMLEAMVRSFETVGYTLRAQDLPRVTGKDSPLAYGVLVFTGQNTDAYNPPTRMMRKEATPKLPSGGAKQAPVPAVDPPKPFSPENAYVVYLIEETPTAGIRLAALGEALGDWDSLRQQYGPPPQDEPLALLAPAFSGSAAGLAHFIASHELWRKYPLEIISGRATSTDVAQALRTARRSGPQVRFHSTVHSDDDMQEAMFSFLVDRLGADCRKIALIVESSTPYGNATYQQDRSLHRGRVRRSHACPPRLLPVPSDLPRLQAEWERKKNTTQTPSAATYEELAKNSLERQRDDSRRTGMLPLFSKETLSERDLSLSALLSTLYQEGIRYVGLMMTDASDKIFLAQRISANCPDARLFTFESELSLVHPQDLAYTRGMLVASTYPLFTRNQQWTYPYSGAMQRLQFASQADQGVYNAALLLLGHPEHLLEYAAPFAPFERWESYAKLWRCTRPSAQDPLCLAKPPVWISAVGRSALVPLEVSAPSDDDFVADRRHALFRAGEKTPLRDTITKIPNSEQRYTPYDMGTVRVLTIVLLLLSLSLGVPFLRNAYGTPLWVSEAGEEARFFDFLKPLPQSPHPLFAKEHTARSVYLLWLSLPLGVLSFYLGLLLALRFRAGNFMQDGTGLLGRFFGNALFDSTTDWSKILDLLYLLMSTTSQSVSWVVTICVLCRMWNRPPRWPRLRRFLTSLGFLSAATLFLSLVALSIAINTVSALDTKDLTSWHGANAILFLRRSAQTSYELSPLLPLLCLLAISFLWGLYNLRRISLVTLRPLSDLPVYSPPDKAQQIQQDMRLCYAQLGSHHRLTVVSVVLLVVLVASPVFGRLTTIDMSAVHLLFRVLFSVATSLIVLAVFRLLLLLWPLEGALHHLRHHPLASALSRIPAAWRRPLGTMLLEELSGATEQQMLEQKLDALAAGLAQQTPQARRQAIPVELHESLSLLEDRVATWHNTNPPPDPMSLVDVDLERAASALLYGTRPPLRPRPAPTAPPDAGAKEPPAPDPLAFLPLAEDLLSTRLVLILGRLLPHLRNSMLVTTSCMVLMLAALWSYPFQPMQWMTILIWLIFLSVCGLTAMVLLQLNRSPILSQLTGTEPGKLSWDSSFLRPVVYYVLIPLLSLLSTQLPEFNWLVKLLQNLK